MEVFVAQLLNGLVYGVLLFLIAAGLSLIFGLMNVVSLAHGSFFMLGAYFGLSIFRITGSFWWALVLAPFPVIALGVLMELLFLRPLYRRGHLDQVLLTFGFTSVFLDLVQTLWGRTVLRLPVPDALQGTVQIGLGVFSAYRLCLIGFGFAIALLLWLVLERSRIGAMVRAGVDNAAMAAGLGGNIPALFTGTFGFGVALAALGGIAAGPVLGLYPGMDTEILIPAFIVIVIGGLGRLRRQSPDRDRRYVRQSLSPEHRAVSDLPRDAGRAADPAAGAVRHQIFRRRDCASGDHDQRAGHGAHAHRGDCRAARSARAAVCACRQIGRAH